MSAVPETPTSRPAASKARVTARRGLRGARRVRARVVGPQAELVALLVRSPLFDADWYAALAGCDARPDEAARHYLEHGSDPAASPHPLFHTEYVVAQHKAKIGDRTPLVAYLTDKRLRRTSPHPLFDLEAYVAADPTAAKHRGGPVVHYVEVGARRGRAPNAWYTVDREAEPQGLTDWVRARHVEWRSRTSVTRGRWSPTRPTWTGGDKIPKHGDVSAVLPIGPALTLLESSVDAVFAQTAAVAELVVVHPVALADEVVTVLGARVRDPRLRLVPFDGPRSAALQAGAAAARGVWLAFCLPSTLWEPHHLQTVLLTALGAHAEAAYDVVRVIPRKGATRFAIAQATRDRSTVDQVIHLGALVVRRSVFEALGGFDVDVHRAAAHDLELRLLQRGVVPLALRAGVTESDERVRAETDAVPLRIRPLADVEDRPSWHQVVIDRYATDWPSLPVRGRTDLVSVIIPTHTDPVMTSGAVDFVHRAKATDPEGPDVEIIVVDNGCSAADAAVLDALTVQYPEVQLLHEPVNRGFAVGNNLAMRRATGDTVVFLNNDTEVGPTWLAPLVDALADPLIHGAQSLLVYPTGSIQSAGIVFPACGGIPHPLLQGFPVEDARGIEQLPLRAATAAALAMRRSDVVALRGFDPIFRNGMEDVDLGLRMCALRPGRFTVRTDSVVVHLESRAKGRFANALANRRILLDRYGNDLPGDDVALWGAQGFDVVGHEVRLVAGEDRRVSPPDPVLVHRRPAQVVEGLPVLRWALKNPAPAGPEGEMWGDTHFVRSLATSLRRIGQEVVIDHRGEFDRASGSHDDVVLILRGLAPYRPIFGQITMAWVISHPEMFSRREAESYDRVFAASVAWSRRTSEAWGVRIDPLLQATDPALFHPDLGRPDTGHPLLFVGSSRKRLRTMVRDSIELGLPLSVYGNHWDELIPAAYVKARYLPNTEVGAAYRRAGIVLNDHWDDMRVEGFLSNRLFDAAASGARIVSDDVEGLSGLFGRSVQAVRTPAELASVAQAPDLDAVFGDDAERRAVARRVHAEHSFDTRAHQLLDAAVELRAGVSRSARSAAR